MPLVGALHVPNAPHLIDPDAFGGRGRRTADALRDLDVARRLRPDGVVVVSPHWEAADRFLVHGGARPPQLYDFSGFPPSLSAVAYRPPGDPALADALVAEGSRRGLPVARTEEWGIDHGGWAPLRCLLPSATRPTVPLSIARQPAAAHVAWGAAIGAAVARSPRRILLVSTGSILHAFSRFDPRADTRWPEGAEMEAEVAELAVRGESEALARFDPSKWAALKPEGRLAPLFVLLGAVGPGVRGRIVFTEQLHGAFGMTILEYLPPA